MKKLLLTLVLLLSLTTFSQTVNDYQYVIVPAKFDFLKEPDKYRLNTTTKLLLQKYGFKSFLSTDEVPAEATSNRCAILYASLVNDNSFFVTKLKVVLKDCQDRVVYETADGSSREKDYHVAYNEALRAAFKSFDQLNYAYSGKSATVVEVVAPAVPETPKPQPQKIIPATIPTVVPVAGQLYAQPIPNGFQLINTEPKVVYKIYNTSVKDYFIASKGEQNGVFFTKNGNWYFEYYANGKLVSETIDVKF